MQEGTTEMPCRCFPVRRDRGRPSCIPSVGQLALRVSLLSCSGETELRSFSRIFLVELQRGFFEKHVWLSMWDRPPRSRFTRVQRATCCSLLIFLFLCANAVWYGVVGNVHLRCAVFLGALASLFPPQGSPVLPVTLGRTDPTSAGSRCLVALSLSFPFQRIWDQDTDDQDLTWFCCVTCWHSPCSFLSVHISNARLRGSVSLSV